MNLQIIRTAYISDTEYADLVAIDGKLAIQIFEKTEDPNIFTLKEQIDA